MSSTAKIILGIIGGITVLCLCLAVAGFALFRWGGYTVTRALNTDPATAANVSSSIAEYTLPAGFGDPFANQAAGFSMVSYTGADNHSHIYLFQLPSYIQVDQAEIERQFRNAGPSGYDNPKTMKVVDSKQGTINGQEVTLVTSEGLNHDGQPYREVAAMFQGKGGQALVVVSGLVSTWDQAVVDSFLASIN
jgi:hypothetical protein